MFGFVVVLLTLWRQLRAAFGTTALENKTPSLSGHPGTKTVCSGALDFTGLIGAFHDYYLDQ